MERRTLLGGLALGVPAGWLVRSGDSDPVVRTTAGAVRGRRAGGISMFAGVPYAAAPVGERRFRPPVPPAAWRGVRDAVRPGPAAPQSPSRLTQVVGPIRLPGQSEDCLSVNVWTPGLRGRRPVLVWLHGGAFVAGAGGQDWYDGVRLAADGDLVVVTVNYRLGALGFLHAPDLGWSNAGLLDQLAALRWVRDNIAGFGGDPGRVTLAGQSAGALTALAMMSAPQARGLFHRVILQSTPTGIAPAAPAEAAAVTERYLAALGMPPGEAYRLRDVPVEQLLAAQGVLMQAAAPLQLAPPFHLVAAGDVVAPDLVGAAGRVSHIGRLVGATRDEAAAWAVLDPRLRGVDEARAIEIARGFAGAGAEHEYARISRTAPGAAPELVLQLLATDHYFHRDVPRLAGHARSYAYRFDWHPAGNPLGACHCLELPYVFGTLPAWRAAPMLAGADPDHEAALVTATLPAWAAFVHTGSPEHGGLPRWPRYDHRRTTMHITEQPHVR
ncbi:carboxylesterase/lipase family protein [Phytohabitans houttuyneae]|uniref:Carboxylic ester hydrolase n=1 Tax=Phytohabitans houttuyneae TaxID=1076126 RepID=A0A6V8KNB7_9ACTN|nr:carboxylesterase family protein [Phytohabitans houttuyneae]GFJ83679.1 carboxylic ester hydrolase [Phytohabitans houttuyneae]